MLVPYEKIDFLALKKVGESCFHIKVTAQIFYDGNDIKN